MTRLRMTLSLDSRVVNEANMGNALISGAVHWFGISGQYWSVCSRYLQTSLDMYHIVPENRTSDIFVGVIWSVAGKP